MKGMKGYSSPYRMIHDPDDCWCMAAKLDDDGIVTLYEGRSRYECLLAILHDLGVNVPGVEREIGDGDYFPATEDWEAPK